MRAGETALRSVHLVGIGGMHMSAIAQLLLSGGVRVSGSDLSPSTLTARLAELGATVYRGHAAENIDDADLVVTTAAAKADNPELLEAARRGIPIIPRHEMVARLMRGRTALAVAGTHGKTTTSSLLAVMLRAAGLEPTYLLGGESIDLGGNAAAGSGSYVVVEADEYAAAFLAYQPQIAIVTNVESDHLDFYGSEERLLAAFRRFLANVPEGGQLILGADSPLLRRLPQLPGAGIGASINWYSINGDADWRAEAIESHRGGGSSFSVRSPTEHLGRFTTLLPGAHMVANAVAAIAAASAVGVGPDILREALAEFRGAHRRFELKGEAGSVLVVDDYAHHPTEIGATLLAARQRYPDRRIVVIFQPHTYSRTHYLLDGFRRCFAEADALYLLQTFAARETEQAGIDAHRLAAEISRPSARFVPDADAALTLLAADLRPGDVLLTMGAGDVTHLGPRVLAELCRR